MQVVNFHTQKNLLVDTIAPTRNSDWMYKLEYW